MTLRKADCVTVVLVSQHGEIITKLQRKRLVGSPVMVATTTLKKEGKDIDPLSIRVGSRIVNERSNEVLRPGCTLSLCIEPIAPT